MAQYRTGIRLRDACLELSAEHQCSCAKMTSSKVIKISESTDVSGVGEINVLHHEEFDLRMVLLGNLMTASPALRKNVLIYLKEYDVIGASTQGLLSQKVKIKRGTILGDLLD